MRASYQVSEAVEEAANITIIMRELERDPPRTKVRVLTDSPLAPRQEIRLLNAITQISTSEG